MERVAFLIEETGERLDCLVNPETVEFRRDAGVRRRTLLGQVVGDSAWSDDSFVAAGGLTEIRLDLMFDTALVTPPAEVANVQNMTEPFWTLAEPGVTAQGMRAPRLARFVWGKTWNVLGIVSGVAERFERFLPNGAPQRSWLRMHFARVADRPGASASAATRLAADSDASSFTLPSATPDLGGGASMVAGEDVATANVTTAGRMDLSAYELTGDSFNWRKLARFSLIDDPLSVAAGVVLRVPAGLLARRGR